MSTQADTSLRVSRVIRTDRETAFRAWTEAEQMKRWAAPEGGTVTRALSDVRVGGRYRIEMVTADGGEHTAVGEYREVEAPSRLVYTWDWEGDGGMGDTLVTVEFREADGGTEVVLTHERFPDVEARDNHAVGWESCLNRLEGMFS